MVLCSWTETHSNLHGTIFIAFGSCQGRRCRLDDVFGYLVALRQFDVPWVIKGRCTGVVINIVGYAVRPVPHLPTRRQVYDLRKSGSRVRFRTNEHFTSGIWLIRWRIGRMLLVLTLCWSVFFSALADQALDPVVAFLWRSCVIFHLGMCEVLRTDLGTLSGILR